MKEKIIAALKTKFSNLGFGEKAFTGVAEFLATTVTDETHIETAITGVEPLLKAFQGDIDKRVSDAIAKTKAELKTDPPTPPKKDEPKPGDDTPAWAKDLIKKVEYFEKRETQQTLMGKLKERLKDRVPDSYLKGRSIIIESEDQIDQLAASIEGDYTELRQELTNQGLYVDLPKKSAGTGEEGTAAVEAIAERRNTGASEGVQGKKI